MAEVIQRRWESAPAGSGLPRRDTRPCGYDAYVPDPLVGRTFVLDGEVAADVVDAEVGITRLNAEAGALIDTEALARILLRAEAVASSRIEGLEIGARRLLHAEVMRGLNQAAADVSATEVLGNIDAMVFALGRVGPGDPITVDLLLDVHRRLVAGTRLEHHGGRLRDEQNWIGGSDYNPCSAVFVPPPPDFVPDLMRDLCTFCSTNELPAVAQAAIAHAQFETIHPFVDGNGRTGRALIHMILRRRGLALRVLPPVSLVLATWARTYVDGLMGYRIIGESTSDQAVEGINVWVGRFAAACSRAVTDATFYEDRARQLQEDWRSRLGTIRAKSGTDLLVQKLPGAPVLTVASAAALIGRTFQPAADAIGRLEKAGILKQVNIGKRNRAFEAPEVIEAFTTLERQLGSPGADTRISEPARRVPYRRKW
jgi:Fic family protein